MIRRPPRSTLFPSTPLFRSILRRPEAYHARLREAAGAGATGAAVSIHEQTRVKEPGLERFLRYDRWPRHAFRILIFDPSRTRSEEHTSELQSQSKLVCRLLL